jgi:hypothetical protein
MESDCVSNFVRHGDPRPSAGATPAASSAKARRGVTLVSKFVSEDRQADERSLVLGSVTIGVARAEADRGAEDLHPFPRLGHRGDRLLAASGCANPSSAQGFAPGQSSRRRLTRGAIAGNGGRVPLVQARAFSGRLFRTLSPTLWRAWGPGPGPGNGCGYGWYRGLPSARARALPRHLLRPLSPLNRPVCSENGVLRSNFLRYSGSKDTSWLHSQNGSPS